MSSQQSAVWLLALLSACHGTSQSVQPSSARQGILGLGPDLPVTEPPYDDVRASYKERLDQPYVFVEQVGSYARTGRLLPSLHQELVNQGLHASGPPFALFYDDPGQVPADKLRSRACFPIEGPAPKIAFPLQYDVLPAKTVAYAIVRGPYPEVPRAYSGLFAYMTRMAWIDDGPIREVYLVPPEAVKSFDELLCEIQIPARAAR